MQNKLGTHFISGLEGTTLLDHEKKLLEKIQPIGLIFFARNFASPGHDPFWKESFLSLIQEAREASQGSVKILSIDYEGGRVHRFPESVKKFPYAREWKNESANIAHEMKDILSSFALNMTYSPVLDVDLEPANPVIGPRSFSTDPEEVTRASLDFFNVMNKAGIITCGKHFPGHGRTTSDSHHTLPKVTTSKKELETDLTPFIALIAEGIPCLMSAHVMYPAFDDTHPASLSRIILNDLLRNQLGFNGLVCTDDLDMKALAHYSSTEKIRRAFKAGTDIMLVGNGMDGKSLETINGIIMNMQAELSKLESHLDKSKERISTLGKRFQL
jgi:beta-N-acetylhexosaminidase